MVSDLGKFLIDIRTCALLLSFSRQKLSGAGMTLTLYQHPLASFCHKVLVALYENATPFRSVIVDFADR